MNRDEFNGRTFEIPACKGFLLTERTSKHLEFYREGVEAEFFSSVEECAEKIRYYLENPEQRLAIAERGYRRAIDSDYSYARRMSDALATVRAIVAEDDCATNELIGPP
jgi:spore maturation protein CgeB